MIFPDYYKIVKAICWVTALAVPLALWKLTDVILWLASHLSWR